MPKRNKSDLYRTGSVVSGAAELAFTYDGDGKMVIKEEADGAKTLYIGNYLEIEIPAEGTQTPTPTPTSVATATQIPTPANTPTVTNTPTATATSSGNLIFADGFESGDLRCLLTLPIGSPRGETTDRRRQQGTSSKG